MASVSWTSPLARGLVGEQVHHERREQVAPDHVEAGGGVLGARLLHHAREPPHAVLNLLVK